MPTNDWKNDAMWFQGHIEDWFERSGRTIVKFPEEGRDPRPFLFFVPPGWLGPIGLSLFASCSTGRDYYRTLRSISFLCMITDTMWSAIFPHDRKCSRRVE